MLETAAFSPSVFQQAIFAFIEHGEGSAAVLAVAGSGKTTTILQGTNYMAPAATAQLFAFNRAIADTLRASITRPRTTAATFHSVGYQALAQAWSMKKLTPTDKKIRDLTRQLLSPRAFDAYGRSFLPKLVSFAKGIGVGVLAPDKTDTWRALVDHHDLSIDRVPIGFPETRAQMEALLTAEALDDARRVFEASIEAAHDNFSLDWDDLLYLPLLWQLPLPTSQWVLIDEAQDTNPVRRELAVRCLADGGRLMAVGDPRQAIYGFTGATVDAMDLLIDQFACAEFPLSVCYRCARRIVAEAQRLVPEILPADDAPDGAVAHLPVREGLRELRATDAVLCRTTAPLVEAAYELIAAGIGCVILGREIGQGLVKLIEKMNSPGVNRLERDLLDYRAREGAKLRARDQDARAAALDDQVACIFTVMGRLTDTTRTVPGLIQEITRLFETDAVTGTPAATLTLSTIHKAKGREWPTVAILRPDLLPGPWATQPWQLTQEVNLEYVAITRAMSRLIYLEGTL